MKIKNAKIENVTVGIDDRDRLSVRMTFKGDDGMSCDWGFNLENPEDVQRLKLLVEYTEVDNVLALGGKIIRVMDHGMFFRGFGHPVENKFVPCCIAEVKEITDEEFRKLLWNF